MYWLDMCQSNLAKSECLGIFGNKALIKQNKFGVWGQTWGRLFYKYF
jgi:hypothetical protein